MRDLFCQEPAHSIEAYKKERIQFCFEYVGITYQCHGETRKNNNIAYHSTESRVMIVVTAVVTQCSVAESVLTPFNVTIAQWIENLRLGRAVLFSFSTVFKCPVLLISQRMRTWRFRLSCSFLIIVEFCISL